MHDESSPRPPVELFDLAVGYQKSKTLFALMELGVPTLLAAGDRPLADLARQLGLHPVAADRLLNAGVALGLLERGADAAGGARYRNSAVAETFLVRGRPAYLGDQFLGYGGASYDNWGRLVERLRAWEPGEMPTGGDEEGQPADEDQGAAALGAQHNLAVLVGRALAGAYDFSRHRKMLDLGGGTGAMSIGVCGAHRELTSVVYDLPHIAAAARRYVDENNLAGRIEVDAGDFRRDELPAGFDLVLLANFLSVAGEETNRRLLRQLYEKLPSGGAVILSGWMLEDSRVAPLVPVLFCLEDITWQAPDVERSLSTYERWLTDAGFVAVERRAYCPPTSLIVGRKE